MEFLLITGAAVLIAILIDRNIDKIDIPRGLVSECLEPDDDFLKDCFEDMNPSIPGTTAWHMEAMDESDPTIPGSLAWIASHKD